MPKRKKMKSMKITAFPRLGSEAKREPISLLMLGKALIERRGLKTRKVRRTFRLELGIYGRISMIPMQTTMKSNQFQGSLR
jgi:hypothetical protein